MNGLRTEHVHGRPTHPNPTEEIWSEMALRTIQRSATRLARVFCLIVAAGMVLAAPAAAAPSFGVELERDEEIVSHSDQRVDYTVDITNTAESVAEVGGVLTCQEQLWFPVIEAVAPELTIEWWRDGEPTGETGQTYVATSADVGLPVQCVITGENEVTPGNPLRFTAASLPAFVVDPQTPPSPPGPSALTNASRPTITNEDGGTRTGSEKGVCHPPTNWVEDLDGDPETAPTEFDGPWSFQWLRNGEPIESADAQTAEYQPVAADENQVLQCQVIGTNAGGSVVVMSQRTVFGSVAQPPNNNAAGTPATVVNLTSGEISVDLQLPGGLGTFVHRTQGADWECTKHAPIGTDPARAVCTNSRVIGPGQSLPTLTVVVGLGGDAPDHALVQATVFGGGATSSAIATDEFTFAPLTPFEILDFTAQVFDPEGQDYTQAGGHAFAADGGVSFPTKRRLASQGAIDRFAVVEHVRQIKVDVPRGFAGNVAAVPELCGSTEDVLNYDCPPGSVVGGVATVTDQGAGSVPDLALVAVEPEDGAIAQFMFTLPMGSVYSIAPRLRPEDGYAVTLESAPIVMTPALTEVTTTLCGFGANTKLGPGGVVNFDGCREADDPDANPVPLLTNPTRCQDTPPTTVARADSWQHPGDFKQSSHESPPLTGCDAVEFEPEITMAPTSARADSPTGMDVELTMPTDGLLDPEGIAQANLKSVKVSLPEGMAVNASASHGLGACTMAQFGIGANGVPNDDRVACPQASKIGTVEMETPLLDADFDGSVYLARQNANPFGSLLALYMAIESEERGIRVKIAGRVDPDPETGRLEVSFDDNPELPFSSVKLNFPQRPRSPLMNPPRCGTYDIAVEIGPWNAADPDDPTPAETVVETSSFEVTEGPGGGPCPTGTLDASFSAGVDHPVAGQTSPFSMRLSRGDGTQRLHSLAVELPQGLSAYLRGIPFCPDHVIAGISGAAGTGQAQADQPSCPAASQIGTVIAGAGSGPSPFYIDGGKAYFAGPYKGAPLSMAIVMPVLAGPLDLGSVVVRTALHVDPQTAQVRAESDPIPRILHGILTNIRDIRVALDRPGFTVNPTNCEEMAVAATVQGDDGESAGLSNRFQVGGCAELDFEPRFSFQALGKRATKPNGHPRITARVNAREGDANIGQVSVVLPRRMIVDQENIATTCTREQFAAGNCADETRVGTATAHSPLLDDPLDGPVYLIASDNPLPDLVADLKGIVDIALFGRIHSQGIRVRNTFDVIPDVPVESFRLTLRGGPEGILVNGADLCERPRFRRVDVSVSGQNGKLADQRRAIQSVRCLRQRARDLSQRARALRQRARQAASLGNRSRAAKLRTRANRLDQRAQRIRESLGATGGAERANRLARRAKNLRQRARRAARNDNTARAKLLRQRSNRLQRRARNIRQSLSTM